MEGNYAKEYNGWHLNVKGGLHESKTQSALKGGTDLDGTKNKSWTANITKNWQTPRDTQCIQSGTILSA